MADARTRLRGRRLVRASVLALGAAPLVGLGFRALRDGLGANPVEAITHTTGEWALRFLVLTLAVTPLRRLLGWSWLAPERRSFGLLSFGYASMHFATYLILDLGLAFGDLAEDVIERPYVTAGFSALLMLTPLAVTSTRAAMRRLGRRWTQLHRLVYPAVLAALLHFAWGVKADLLEPAIYAGIVGLLLLLRLPGPLRRQRASSATAATPS